MSDPKSIIPVWLEKGKKIKMPSGFIIIFSGENPEDYLIEVAHEQSNFHATFVIHPDDFEFHVTDQTKPKPINKIDFFRRNKEVFLDIAKSNLARNHKLVTFEKAKAWLIPKEFVLDINSHEFLEIERQNDFWDVVPESMKKHIVSGIRLNRLLINAGAAYNEEGIFQRMLMPNRKNGTYLIIPREFADAILDTCIGITWFKEELKKYF